MTQITQMAQMKRVSTPEQEQNAKALRRKEKHGVNREVRGG